MIKTTHIGDGVYATYSAGDVWLDCRAQEALTTGPNGHPGICLERWVLTALNNFVAECDVRQRDENA